MKQWPTIYSCKVIEPGIIAYNDIKLGILLLKKETIDRIAPSIIGKPVVVRHQHVTPENQGGLAVGYVVGIHYNSSDAWFYVDFLITDDKLEVVDREDGSVVFKDPKNGELLDGVSCSYDVTNTSKGGVWHDIKFEAEILDGSFTHLAIVLNPRYEETNRIVEKSAYMLVNGKEAVSKREDGQETNSKEGSQMKIFKIFRKLTNGKEEEVEDKLVDVDGKEVPLSELVKTYQAEEVEKAFMSMLETANSKFNSKGVKIEHSNGKFVATMNGKEIANGEKIEDVEKKAEEEIDKEEKANNSKTLKHAKDEDTVDVDGKKISVKELKNCYSKKALKNAEDEAAAKEKEKKEAENSKAQSLGVTLEEKDGVFRALANGVELANGKTSEEVFNKVEEVQNAKKVEDARIKTHKDAGRVFIVTNDKPAVGSDIESGARGYKVVEADTVDGKAGVWALENAKKGEEFFTRLQNAGNGFVEDPRPTEHKSKSQRIEIGRQRYGAKK